MAARLEISWDGNAPGLDEKRLSLEAFGKALRVLVSAIRRIASDLEQQADPGASSRGRLATDAQSIDVQLVTIKTNSPVTLTADVVFANPPRRPLIDDLPERAAEAFLRGVRREAHETWTNSQSRRFLMALPAGVTSQTYQLLDPAGAVLESFALGTVSLPKPRPSAHLVEVDGSLVGVGFEEGRPEVKVRSVSGELVTFDASDDQVDQAFDIRRRHVAAIGVVQTAKPRLLILQPDRRRALSAEDRKKLLFSRWDSLLARLAR